MSIAALDPDEGEYASCSIFREAAQRVEADHILLNAAAAQQPAKPAVRLWRNQRCLVVGKAVTRQHGFERTRQLFAQKNIPVIIRSTGGTVVPHGPGTLNVSVIRSVPSGERSVASSYNFLCDGIIHALGKVGITAFVGAVPGSYCDGDYNIVVRGRKLAGTAQRWKKSRGEENRWCVLVHASIAVGDQTDDHALVSQFYNAMGWATLFSPEKHTSLVEEMAADQVFSTVQGAHLENGIRNYFVASGCDIKPAETTKHLSA